MLGCGLRAGAASPALIRRIERGVQLFRQGAAPLLLFSGGGRRPGPREAEIMRAYALRQGVPEAAILVELASRNTFENARETAPLLLARGLCRILLVSDFYHLPRARLLFRSAGLVIVAAHHPGRRISPLLWAREIAAFALSLWRLRQSRRS